MKLCNGKTSNCKIKRVTGKTKRESISNRVHDEPVIRGKSCKIICAYMYIAKNVASLE